MKPSNFKSYPLDSVMQKSECEIVARNIMVILERTGDVFRNLSWEEYKEERINDGGFSSREKEYFTRVIDYCSSEERAREFSIVWTNIKE